MAAKKRTNVATDKPESNNDTKVKKSDKKSKKASKSEESGVEKVRGWVYILIFICMGGFIANKVFNIYEKNTIEPIGDFVAGTKGHLLNYWCDGPSTSEHVVIFVEDAATSYFQSWKFLKSISESARVCAYDRVGRGFSDSPAGAITVNDTLADLAIIVKTVAGTKPVVFVGHGFGSLISTVYSLNQTGQVKGLVLFNPVGPSHYDNGNGEAVFGALRPWLTVAEMGTITGLMRVVEYFGFVKGWGYEFYPEVASVLKYNLNQQRVFLVGSFELDSLQKDFVTAFKNSTKSTIGAIPVKIVNSEQYNVHLSELANSLWTKTRDDKALKSLSTDVETVTLPGTWNDLLVVKHEETADIVKEFTREL